MSLPRVFRQSRLLLVGCGDVGLRVLPLINKRMRVRVLTTQMARVPILRQAGALPVVANLDQAASLRRISAMATTVLHLAPPPAQGVKDPRTRALLQALSRGLGQRMSHPRLDCPQQVLVYGSTSGVYGDAQGAWVSESRAVQPQSDRAHRRVDAETQLRLWGRRQGRRACSLRIPGIYARDREGGDPVARVAAGAKVLVPEQDIYTNHIQADDLARACVLALWRGRPQRRYNICDDTSMKMGDYFEAVAQMHHLPLPTRLTREQAERQLSPMSLSFMNESRRLHNQRMKTELGLRLRYPQVLLALSLLVSGCAAAPVVSSMVTPAAVAVSAGSAAVTGKTPTDHVVSYAVREDCGLLRVLWNEPFCNMGEREAPPIEDRSAPLRPTKKP